VPPALMFTIGVVVFALGLLASIALHEVGHMVPAKKFGVKVTQYMVGFGPTLWSRKRGDTEYGLKAIPAGGYIRMIGMVPPRADGKRSRWPQRMATAVEDFRQVSRAEVEPGDEPRQFYRLTPGKKMIVMLGGPCMNLLIYLVLTVLLLLLLGTEHSDPTTTVGDVSKCVVAANSPDANSTTCPAGAKVAPALGKLQPGDRIESVNGTAVTSWDQLVSVIEKSPGRTLNLVVARHGSDVDVAVVPTRNLKYADDSGTTLVEAGFLGISTKTHDYFQRESITAVPGQIGSQIKQGADALGRYPQKLKSLYETVFHGKARDPQGAVGVVGIGRLSGDFAKSSALDGQEKLATLVGLLASVNLLLFFFNLLPLLPLDGGHVAGAIVEAIKRGRARLRARSARPVAAGSGGTDGFETDGEPAHKKIFVDTAQMLPVMYAVASVLIVVTLFTLYADIVDPIKLSSL
jgi:membrane-associated protease RseP (regulator of RpoE activity)